MKIGFTLQNTNMALAMWSMGRDLDDEETFETKMGYLIEDFKEALDGSPDAIEFSFTTKTIDPDKVALSMVSEILNAKLSEFEDRLKYFANFDKNIFPNIQKVVEIFADSEGSMTPSYSLIGQQKPKVIEVYFQTYDSGSDDIVLVKVYVEVLEEKSDEGDSEEDSAEPVVFASYKQFIEIIKKE